MSTYKQHGWKYLQILKEKNIKNMSLQWKAITLMVSRVSRQEASAALEDWTVVHAEGSKCLTPFPPNRFVWFVGTQHCVTDVSSLDGSDCNSTKIHKLTTFGFYMVYTMFLRNSGAAVPLKSDRVIRSSLISFLLFLDNISVWIRIVVYAGEQSRPPYPPWLAKHSFIFTSSPTTPIPASLRSPAPVISLQSPWWMHS